MDVRSEHIKPVKALDMQSSYITADVQDELSILYSNIYIVNGEMLFLTVNDQEPPYVNKWTNMYPWRPKIVKFASHEELNGFISNIPNLFEIPLAVYGDITWVSNIGHALYDGLYPLFLALVKFSQHEKDFTLIVNHWENYKEMSFEAITDFCRSPILELDNVNSRNFHVKALISGTGRTGNRVIREDYTLYGTSFNAMELFKKRMLSTYNVQIDLPVNKVPRIFVIDNKRYSQDELEVINKAIEHYKQIGYDIQYIYWQHNRPLKNQLKMLEDVDIHMSAPGTSLNYMSFLKKGAININLGWMERTQTNTMRPNLIIPNASKADYFVPGYMEQCVMTGSNYVTTLYYDRYKYNNIEFAPLIEVINKAIFMAQNNILKQNCHFLDAIVFKEYCKRSKDARKVCDHLTSIAFFIEFFVNEHPAAIAPSFVDIELLRKIKDEFNFDRKYEIKV